MCPANAPSPTPVDYSRLSRRQAQLVAGVSRATLARKVQDGTLSAGKDAQAHNTYDAAELQRAFPGSFDLKRLEIGASYDGVDIHEAVVGTPRDKVELASLTLEKRYLTDERDRLREEMERLRRELAEERRSRETERSEFMALIRQQGETVKQLTDQSQRPLSASQRRRGFLDWLLNRIPH